ncbi:hypothetical protein YC2023_017368 [Brassica napus]
MAPSGSTYKESLESNWIGLAYEVRMSPLEKSVQARAMVFMSFSNLTLASTFANFPIVSQWPHVMFKLQTTSAEHVRPTCRYELGNIRCLALEKVAESFEVSCRYQSLGCHDIFPYYRKVKHEQHCSDRRHSNPLLSISKTIIKSICIVVALSTTVNVNSNPQEVENATWMLTGFPEASETVTGRSVSQDGLIIPRNMALFFSGSDKEERKLRVTGRIWREE